jgi:hypothetical protein
MALRIPLVINAGQIQQLQSGDTLDAVQSGGDAVVQTNDEAGAIVIGTPVYNDVADGVKKARANAVGTTYVLGLVRPTSITNGTSGAIQISGVLTATTGQWDTAFGTTGGLTVGADYYLSSAVAGVGTVTAPTAAGTYVVYLGRALSTTELNVTIGRPILL